MASWAHYASIISLKRVDICRAAISAVHKIPGNARFVLQDEHHPLNHRITQRYKHIQNGTINREKEGLWLIVGANNVHRKRVVRSWARRRVMQAIVQQLRANGFDIKGRKLRGAKDQDIHDRQEIEGLIGLADISILEKSVGCRYEELLRQAGLLVQEIVRRCGKRRGDSSTTKPADIRRVRAV